MLTPKAKSKAACQLINGTVSARSIFAEKMAANNKTEKCGEHSLFHNWVALTSEERRDLAGRSYGVRFDGYVEITPGKWILRDQKPPKKKSD